MNAVLFRTGSGSIPVQTPHVPGSPRQYHAFPKISVNKIRRCSSESDVVRLECKAFTMSTNLGSRFFLTPPDEDDCHMADNDWSADELGFSGGGMNMNGTSAGGGGGYGGNGGDRSKIRAYYQDMLKSDSTNSLLLRNYGKYLHEVEKDAAKAEEYYGRAILANPGDGEVLSLYGKLIWDTQRDELRAKYYFQQALHASPHDWYKN